MRAPFERHRPTGDGNLNDGAIAPLERHPMRRLIIGFGHPVADAPHLGECLGWVHVCQFLGRIAPAQDHEELKQVICRRGIRHP
jgi:hypothetical protein